LKITLPSPAMAVSLAQERAGGPRSADGVVAVPAPKESPIASAEPPGARSETNGSGTGIPQTLSGNGASVAEENARGAYPLAVAAFLQANVRAESGLRRPKRD
jgi:hypothetical protein